MEIETLEGNVVPTYGGPFDSFTIPELDETDGDGGYVWQHYDHDYGGWREPESVSIEYIEHHKPIWSRQ